MDHHPLERGNERPLRIGQEGRDAGESLLLLGVEDMQDRANEQRMAGLFPVIAAFQRALGIDENVGDVLDVADFVLAAANLKKRIVVRRSRVGRVEE